MLSTDAQAHEFVVPGPNPSQEICYLPPERSLVIFHGHCRGRETKKAHAHPLRIHPPVPHYGKFNSFPSKAYSLIFLRLLVVLDLLVLVEIIVIFIVVAICDQNQELARFYVQYNGCKK